MDEKAAGKTILYRDIHGISGSAAGCCGMRNTPSGDSGDLFHGRADSFKICGCVRILVLVWANTPHTDLFCD